jgi:hypothetical protein
MYQRKIKAKDLEIGMDYLYQPRQGKYVISKIWDLEYYDTVNGARVRIFFNNMKSRTAKENRLFKIIVSSPICIPRNPSESTALKAYFENLESYKIGSTICKCGVIVPKGSIWHRCNLWL